MPPEINTIKRARKHHRRYKRHSPETKLVAMPFRTFARALNASEQLSPRGKLAVILGVYDLSEMYWELRK